jgi:hypothetical protein
VPNVAISEKGMIAAMWRNWLGGARDLYLATSTDGRTFSPSQKLGSGTWKLEGCPMDGGGLAFSPDGKWHTAWRRDTTVFTAAADAPETKLAADSRQPVTAHLGSAPLTVWETAGGLTVQRGVSVPTRLADSATAAALVADSKQAFVAWETIHKTGKGIVVKKLESVLPK